MKKVYVIMYWCLLLGAEKGLAQTTQVVGGANTNIDQVPWQVLLDVNGGLCGGSIIAPNWIVTACHCVQNLSPGQVQVFAGITNQATERNAAQRPAVAQIIRHPGYGTNPASQYDNDIALLRLSTPLMFNANVQPIAYATNNGNLTNPGTNVLVSGWGRIAEGGQISNILQSVNINIADNALGERQYNNLASPNDRLNITGNMLVAGVENTGGRDACQGDSGGPLVAQDANNPVLVGIVSYGVGCARANFLGVYTRVRNYCNWILQQMAQSTAIDGPNNLCAQGTYILQNQPFNTALTWSSNNVNALAIAGNGLATRQNNSNAGVTITATINNACATVNISRYVDVGAGQLRGTYQYCGYTYPVQSSNGIAVNNSCSTVFVNLTSTYDPNTTYFWSPTSQSGNGITYSSGQNTATATISGGRQFSFSSYGRTGCGDTAPVTFSVYNTSGGGFRMAAYPNPASQDLTVAAIKRNGSDQQADFEDEGIAADKPVDDNDMVDIDAVVRLLTQTGYVVQESKLSKGKAKFNVNKLSNGIYYLHMQYKDKQIRKQISIQH